MYVYGENQRHSESPKRKDRNSLSLFCQPSATWIGRAPSLSVAGTKKAHSCPIIQQITCMHKYTVPGTPLILPFHEELRNNCRIDIGGEVCSSEKKFFIEILCGPHSLLNIEFSFHCNKSIVLRSCSSDIDSNQSVNVENPLRGGAKFRLVIVVRHNYYEILLDGYSIALFPHRYPPQLAQCLAISKFVNIYYIYLKGFSTKKNATKNSPSKISPKAAFNTMSITVDLASPIDTVEEHSNENDLSRRNFSGCTSAKTWNG